MNALALWLLLILGFYLTYQLGVRSAAARQLGQAKLPAFPTDKLRSAELKVASLLLITGHKVVGDQLSFDGQLRGPSKESSRKLDALFAEEDVTPLLLEGEGHDVRVLLLPAKNKAPLKEKPNWPVHWLLLIATLGTTTWAGALSAGVNLLREPGRFTVGLPYSVALLVILGAHELGHYFTARIHGIRVTPPFFVPIPFALGTFGAFIKIKSLAPDRRALFDVAVAGPLAGLLFAIPALLIGLRFSPIVHNTAPSSFGAAGVNIDSSLMLTMLAHISLGSAALQGSYLQLHPLAFAGWLGLIVTALNLLPIGQLDGGHLSHALFGGRRARGLSQVALGGLFFLALFVWPGLMFWAFIVFFIAGTRDMPAIDDVSPVGVARLALGYFAFLLLLLIIVPVPHSLHQMMGLHSPYL